jgi:hypothetical protein
VIGAKLTVGTGGVSAQEPVLFACSAGRHRHTCLSDGPKRTVLQRVQQRIDRGHRG